MKIMNKKSLVITITILSIGVLYFNSNKESKIENQRKEYAEFVKNHPYSKRKNLSEKELQKIPKKDRPDLAFEQDFLRTIDPKTKKIHQDRLVNALNYAKEINEVKKFKKSTETTFNWKSRGPKKVSGRIRAFMFDPNDLEDKKVFTGGVSGGIWTNNDITEEDSAWEQVAEDISNFAISVLDFDPIVTTTFYAGTGEGWGNIDAVNGSGIWKSIDGGITWSNLSSTVNFEYVYDLVVVDEGGTQGVIYASMRDIENVNSTGTDLFRSQDGGETWTIVSTESFRDLEKSSNNDLWAGTSDGRIFSSINGVAWELKFTSELPSLGRVELATAPTNSDVIYALISSENKLGEIIKTTDSGVSWSNLNKPIDSTDSSIPEDDFTRGQAWYDFIINVNPSNESEVFVGGINLFKSQFGGSFWVKISSWSDFFDDSVSIVHADQHNIVFRPNHNQMIVTNDGGVFFASDLNSLTPDGFSARNLNLNVTQFYYGAIDPININGFLGGAQDNGTNYFFEPGLSNTTEILGGDGGFCFIDQTANDGVEGIYYLASTQWNVTHLFDSSQSTSVNLVNNSGSGNFINSSDYDDENNIFYSYNGANSITRAILKPDYENQGSGFNFLGVKDTLNIPLLFNSDVSHTRVSPYNKESRKVFFGGVTGRLIQLNTSNEITSELNKPNVVASISCIEIGESDDELLITYSNYGVQSVWYTNDGGVTWIDKEGNLPDMPIRWSLFNPLNRKQVILATEAGVWKTEDILADTVIWEPASSQMGSVRVDMLEYRESDNLILAATHGRGMFTGEFTGKTNSLNSVLVNKKEFTLYPTITNGNFTIFAENSLGKTKMNIFDINGKQVYKSNIDFTYDNELEVSVNLNAGIYIVNLLDKNNNKSSNKIVIE